MMARLSLSQSCYAIILHDEPKDKVAGMTGLEDTQWVSVFFVGILKIDARIYLTMLEVL